MLYPAIAFGMRGVCQDWQRAHRAAGGGGLRQRDGLVHTDVLFAGVADAAVFGEYESNVSGRGKTGGTRGDAPDFVQGKITKRLGI